LSERRDHVRGPPASFSGNRGRSRVPSV